MLLIWKEYFTCAILSFSSPRCAIIARLNVIYTKFRRAMIAQLNKIWRVWACARAIAHHSRPGLLYLGTTAGCSAIYKPRLGQRCPMVVKMLNIVNVPTRLCSLALTLEKKYSKQYFLRVGEFWTLPFKTFFTSQSVDSVVFLKAPSTTWRTQTPLSKRLRSCVSSYSFTNYL